MKKISSFLMLIFVVFAGCESDDVCDAGTPTTPKVVIEFYNFNNQSLLKNVTNLTIVGQGLSTGLVLNSGASTDAEKYFFNSTKIAVPLKIDQSSTTYNFILNAKLPAIPITDVVKFNYIKVDEYVSRACGYRNFFDFNSSPVAITINNGSAATSGFWIKDVQILKQTIKDETTTHVKIFI